MPTRELPISVVPVTELHARRTGEAPAIVVDLDLVIEMSDLQRVPSAKETTAY
jgi:hypothetical protein